MQGVCRLREHETSERPGHAFLTQSDRFGAARGKSLFSADAPVIPLRDMEKAYILHALRRANGKLTGKNSAAEMLDINGGTLRSRMVRLGLDPKKRSD